MTQVPLLTAQNLQLGFGGEPLFTGIDLAIGARERLCLVGRNGMGKSTFMKILASRLEPDAGTVDIAQGKVVTYLPQEPDFSHFSSVRAALLDVFTEHEREDYKILPMAEELGLDVDSDPAILSGGGRRRVALARAFLADPDLLLLDEPTNHLDLPAIDWVEKQLQTFKGAWILISHDRRLLEKTANGTLWLDRGKLHRSPDGYAKFEAFQAYILNEEAREIEREKQHIKAEQRYLERGVTARRTRNQGRLRKLAALRERSANRIAPTGQVALSDIEVEGSARKAIEAKGISKRFGEKIIVKDFSTRLLAGDKVALIGPNGVGKTTLIKLLLKELESDTGCVSHGARVETVFVDQNRGDLAEDKTVQDILADGGDYVDVRGEKRHITGYLKDFLFEPAQMRSPVSSLSGGERGRLLLARAFAKPANLMVLDEPTNDLDLDTLTLLEDVLSETDMTLLLVSHDRDFIDAVATSTIAPLGSGVWREYPGGYSDFIRQEGNIFSAETKAPERKPAKVVPLEKSNKPKSAQKLSYKDQRRLDALPALIEQIQADIDEAEASLADPDFFQRDPEGFTNLSNQLATLQDDVASMEEEWLTLEEKREALSS